MKHNLNKYAGNPLWNMGLETIKSLETDSGILASSRNELYGCIFGRDSLITALKLMRAYDNHPDPYFLALCKKILVNLKDLQGTTINLESGEEPGKMIHEYRPDNHDHLTKALEKPWYVYPDNTMRNYDSVDSTPLFLIAVHRYFKLTGDTAFIEALKPNIYGALDWLVVYGDSNHDGFIDYQLNPERSHGGLETQSWMDSSESVFHEDGEPVAFPIAPVEVQAYTYTALKAWAEFFSTDYEARAEQYSIRAEQLKQNFNEKFVSTSEDGSIVVAAGIDGNGKPLTSLRSSIGHCLWATWSADGPDGSILKAEHIAPVANRLMQPDMFEPQAGIRTLSQESNQYDPTSYHNGSIWPHDNAIIAEGLENFGFHDHAAKVRTAIRAAISHFNTAIELFVFDKGQYSEYQSPTGHQGCREQAWSAASLISEP